MKSIKEKIKYLKQEIAFMFIFYAYYAIMFFIIGLLAYGYLKGN
jgi:hypothetical protein